MRKLAALWRSWRRDEQCVIVICLMFLSWCGGESVAQRYNAAPLPPVFQEAQSSTTTSTVNAETAKTGAGKTILVHVNGAVSRPGLIQLPATARVMEAIERAGGVSDTGDIHAINLAAVLKDGQQVHVPQRAAADTEMSGRLGIPDVPSRSSTFVNKAGAINVNTASAAELEALPGIGPAIAARIIEYRQQHGEFKHVEDLDAVKGIGVAKLDKLRGLVTF